MNGLFQEIFEACIIPLLIIFARYFAKYVNKRADEIDNEQAKEYTKMLADIIKKATIKTNQTYVDALKNQNLFDDEAQAEAFKRTYKNVIDILSKESIEVLETLYNDLYSYISTTIEAEVSEAKKAKASNESNI